MLSCWQPPRRAPANDVQTVRLEQRYSLKLLLPMNSRRIDVPGT